jgi:outer membrane protein assembly factor BamB
MRKSHLLVGSFLLILSAVAVAQQQDWPTWGGNPERTGWAKSENAFNRDNVSRLELKWKTQLDETPFAVNYYGTITDPIVVDNVATRQGTKTLVFVAGRQDSVYAIDADTGKVVWQRKFPNTLKPPQPPDTACPNDLNATPTVDKQKGILYVLNTDGKLRGVSLADGEDRFPATAIVEPFTRNWSLNFVDGVIYTTVGRGCGGAKSHFVAFDVNNPSRPLMQFFTSNGRPGGAWGKGGMVAGPQGLYTQTADGPYDPAAGRFAESVLAFSNDLHLVDSFTPPNWPYLNQKDLDIGSGTPAVVPFDKWTLLAVAGKEGLIYLLDAKDLGGEDHHTALYTSPRYSNDAVVLNFAGMWAAMSNYADAQDRHWLFVPMQGPVAKAAPKFRYTNGEVQNGGIMAFQLKVENGKPALDPVWVSRDLEVPGTPLITNGVVFAISTGDRGRMAASARAYQALRTAAANPVVSSSANIGDLHGNWNSTQRGEQGQHASPTAQRSDLSHTVLYAFDPESGKELWSSGDIVDSWSHTGQLAVAKGRIYLSTWDARVYAFGLK